MMSHLHLGLVHSEGATLRTKSATLRTEDATLRTEDATLRTEGATFRTECANFRTEGASFSMLLVTTQMGKQAKRTCCTSISLGRAANSITFSAASAKSPTRCRIGDGAAIIVRTHSCRLLNSLNIRDPARPLKLSFTWRRVCCRFKILDCLTAFTCAACMLEF
eukprot:2573781-Pleurochrysis_carterae.AAC.4